MYLQAGSHRCYGWALGLHGSVLGAVTLTQKHLVILRRVRHRGRGCWKQSHVLVLMHCPVQELGHIKCVLMPDTGHAPSYHFPVLFLLTLHLFKASFSEVMCEGEMQVRLEWQHHFLGRVTHAWAVNSHCFIAMQLFSEAVCLSDYARISSFQKKNKQQQCSCPSWLQNPASGCEPWSPLLSKWKENEESYADYSGFL